MLLFFFIVIICIVCIVFNYFNCNKTEIILADIQLDTSVLSISPTINLYYINMDKSTGRKQKLLNDISHCSNIIPTRVKAITPTEIPSLKINRDETCYIRDEKELACTLSHIKAIYTAYKNNDEVALISEDDVMCLVQPDINKILNTNTPKDWDILQLLAFHKYDFYKNNFGKNIWIPHKDGDTSAAIYIINRKGMEKILNRIFKNGIKEPLESNTFELTNMNKRISCAADWMLYSLCNTYIYSDLYFNIKGEDTTLDNYVQFQNKTRDVINNLHKKLT